MPNSTRRNRKQKKVKTLRKRNYRGGSNSHNFENMQENSQINIQKNRDKYFDKIQDVIYNLKRMGYSNTDKLCSMKDGEYKYKMLMIIYMMNVINQQYNRVSSK